MFLDRNPSVCICLLRDDACNIHQSQEPKPSGLQLSLCHTLLFASSSNHFHLSVVTEIKWDSFRFLSAFIKYLLCVIFAQESGKLKGNEYTIF